MNFEFSEAQQLMRQSAQRYLAGECPRSRMRESTARAEPFDRALWLGMAEMGWTGVTIPEEYGGLGLGHLEQAVIAEEIGRSLAPVPFSSSVYMATEAILLGGSDELKQKYLPGLASGELVGTFAFHESVDHSGWSNVKTTFSERGLSGEKKPVMDGDVADIAVVTCDVDGTRRLAVVNLHETNVERERLGALDLTRGLSSLSFSQTPAELLDDRAGLFDTLLDRGATLLAFEQIGGAEQCLHDARDYALNRYAFGRQIGSFQAIKHKLADQYVALELARSNAYYAIWTLISDAEEFPVAAAAAHISACKAHRQCAQESLHVHGGMGYTWEVDCHFFLRRAIVSGLLLGQVRHWKHSLVDKVVRGAH
ncbi:MAG: acyl-CoA/acyl-ACP dehydrogenase [Gammaproteobacteria bacterium]|nr:acyl-CoA/acyl-ACP dehydrogenase [Gammaproteobacteria bacterium]